MKVRGVISSLIRQQINAGLIWGFAGALYKLPALIKPPWSQVGFHLSYEQIPDYDPRRDKP